jgi:AbrB family looped-hinge helix DNA binding protein
MKTVEYAEPVELRTRVRVSAKGRFVIPAAVRKSLGIIDGGVLDLRVKDDELHISTIRGRIRRAQRNVRHLALTGTLVSEELSAERREAAKNE